MVENILAQLGKSIPQNYDMSRVNSLYDIIEKIYSDPYKMNQFIVAIKESLLGNLKPQFENLPRASIFRQFYSELYHLYGNNPSNLTRKQLIDSYGILSVSKYDYYLKGDVEKIPLDGKEIYEAHILKDGRLILIYEETLKIFNFKTRTFTDIFELEGGMSNIIELPNNKILIKSNETDHILTLDLTTMDAIEYPISEIYRVDNMKILSDERIVFIDYEAKIHLIEGGKIVDLIPGESLRNTLYEYYEIPIEILSEDRIITAIEEKFVEGTSIIEINPNTKKGKYIITGSGAYLVPIIKNLSDGKIVYVFLSDDGNRLEIWNSDSKEKEISLERSTVSHLIEDSGSKIILGSDDGMIRILDTDFIYNTKEKIIYIGILDLKIIVITSNSMYMIE